MVVVEGEMSYNTKKEDEIVQRNSPAEYIRRGICTGENVRIPL